MVEKSNSDTKIRALELAREYLQTSGFGGFSFQHIADSLGIKKASLHYYFSSKEEMGLALLKEYEEGHKLWARKVDDLPAIIKLGKMIKGFKTLSAKNHMFCPVGAFTTDFDSLSPKMKKRIRAFHLLIRDWLVETIDQGKKEGTIKRALDTKVSADLFICTLQGGVQLARVRGEEESLKKMLDTLLENLYVK